MRELIITAVVGLAAFSGCAKDKDASGETKHDDLPTVTVDDVEAGLAANTLTAVDCNGEKTRRNVGIVPGAVLISDEEAFTAAELPADKTRKLVFYCSGPS